MSHHGDLHSHMEVEGLQIFCWLVLSRNKKPRKEKHFFLGGGGKCLRTILKEE